MFIDTHCHLNFKDYNDDLQHVITSAKKAGVKRFIVPGVDTPTSGRAVALSRLFAGSVYASCGVHPYEAQRMQSVHILKGLLPQVVAVGECGLDYHQYKGHEASGRKDNQKRLFESHLALAQSASLPVIIHSREAFEDLFSVLDAQPAMPRGVIHCFSGGLLDARQAEARGLYVGFDGNITYSTHLQTIIPTIPLERILIETDSPLLTPEPYRGTRNEPKNVRLVAKEIARLKNIPLAEVERVTEQNARALFPFDRIPGILT